MRKESELPVVVSDLLEELNPDFGALPTANWSLRVPGPPAASRPEEPLCSFDFGGEG